jgi:hypothetical protein
VDELNAALEQRQRDETPIAFESFQRGEADWSLIARIYPQFAQGRGTGGAAP